MKIKNKLLSLVVAMLAGCCFFGTCAEAKPKNVYNATMKKDKEGKDIFGKIFEKEKCAENEFVRYVRWKMFAQKSGLMTADDFRDVDKKFNRVMEDFVKENKGRDDDLKHGEVSLWWFFEYNLWKKFLKKHGLINEVNIEDMDKKVQKAFETYVKDNYNGSVDCCFICEGDGLSDLICCLSFGIEADQWEKGVKNAIKKLKGKRPFKKGVIDIKKLLADGNVTNSSRVIDNIRKNMGADEHSMYSEEFVKLLAKELKVNFKDLGNCMSFGDLFNLNTGKKMLSRKKR